MIYFTLFIEFFKIGLFSIGGGMATIPFLIDLTTHYNWFTAHELTDMIAVSESTPGPIGINVATYAGFQTAGILGAFVSTFALVLPAFIIIILIARFMSSFSDNPSVQAVFTGIRPVVTALILAAVWEIARLTFFTNVTGSLTPLALPCVLGMGLFALMQIPKIKYLHPVLWILGGAMLGVIFRL